MADYTSEEDQAFFAAIGRLTISWAQIELGLDCSIDIIHRFLGGEKIAPDGAPRTSLYRKIKYIRKWAKLISEPTFVSATRKLLDEIEIAAETRHDMIHGIIVRQEEGTGEAEMVRVIHSAMRPVDKKYFTVTTVDILRAAVVTSKLGTRSLNMGTGLQELVPVLAELGKNSEKRGLGSSSMATEGEDT